MQTGIWCNVNVGLLTIYTRQIRKLCLRYLRRSRDHVVTWHGHSESVACEMRIHYLICVL